MDIKDYCGEISDRNEEHIIRHWRKDDLCDRVAKNLAELWSATLQKVAFMSDVLGYLEEISKQNIEGVLRSHNCVQENAKVEKRVEGTVKQKGTRT